MYADTVSELLSAVIPGYDELPSNENGDEAAFVARYEAAIELANLVQTGLVIGDVGQPDLVERVGVEVAAHQVIVDRGSRPLAAAAAAPVHDRRDDALLRAQR